MLQELQMLVRQIWIPLGEMAAMVLGTMFGVKGVNSKPSAFALARTFVVELRRLVALVAMLPRRLLSLMMYAD